MVDGEDVRPGTTAEVLATLSSISLHAMPTRTAQFLYRGLFEEVYPEQAEKLDSEAPLPDATEYEKQEVRELRETMRRKLSHPRGTK